MKVLVAVDESETAEKAFQCESNFDVLLYIISLLKCPKTEVDF